jgi:hypothetical protein
MKELDRNSIELSKDLRAMELSYIQKLRSGGQDDRVLLDAIELLRNKIKQKLSEKTAIGRNLLHELDRFTRKLDSDLAFFETDLKKYGGFEQAKKGERNARHRLLFLTLKEFRNDLKNLKTFSRFFHVFYNASQELKPALM